MQLQEHTKLSFQQPIPISLTTIASKLSFVVLKMLVLRCERSSVTPFAWNSSRVKILYAINGNKDKEESISYKNFLVHRIQFLSSITRGGEDGNGLKVGNIGQRFAWTQLVIQKSTKF